MKLVCPTCSETMSVTEAQTSGDAANCPRCHSTFSTVDAPALDSFMAWQRFSQKTTGVGSLFNASEVPELPDFEGYEMQAFVAHGGFGVVLKARHLALDRTVAIKMPLPGRLTKQADRERFLGEARFAAKLRHPNICPIFEVGEYRSQPYIAMGYIEGPTLRDWAKAAQPTPRQTAEKVAALARAAGYAHRHGVVHRDIKPNNVIVDPETGQPILTDFGLAKDIAQTDPHITRAGQVMGTPAYMAPEQAAGRLDLIGPASDIYALGAVLFDLLCGRPPFLGSSADILHMVQAAEPPRVRQFAPRVHRDLETICMKAVAKFAADRYSSGEAMAEDLERFVAGEPVRARRQNAATRLLRKARRNPLVTAAIVVTLAGLAVGTYFQQRAAHARRVVSTSRAFEDLLERTSWAPVDLASMDALLADMGSLGPAQALDGRERMHRRLAAHIRSQMHRPVIGDADVARIREGIELLAARDAPAAEALNRELADRRSGWRTVFDLKAPFQDVGAVLNAGEVDSSPRALRLRPYGRGEPRPYVLTSQSCAGSAQLVAWFDESWQEADRLGVVLNADEKGKGYAFVLSTTEFTGKPTPLPRPAFSQARQAGGNAFVQVIRDGMLLRQAALPLAAVDRGGLKMTAMREGDRLTLQINQHEPTVFLDVLPLATNARGVFGVLWPKRAGLVRLWASSRTLPAKASPLERGHDLYTRRLFAEAQEQYRLQADQTEDEEVRQEARYREALCLLAQNRSNEAQRAFESVAAAAGPRWPALASCQLWRIHLVARRMSEAEAAYESLLGRYSFEQLAMLLGDEDRQTILQFYRRQIVGLGLLQFRPSRPEDLRRVVAVYDLLGVSGAERDGARYQLVRVYSAAGMHDHACREAEKLMDAGTSWGQQVCEEYCWILRNSGQAQRALEEVNRRYLAARRTNWEAMLVERARIHAALGKWDLAEKDVDEFLALPDQRRVTLWYAHHSGACLMKGFLRKRAHDDAGAVEAWRRGYLRPDSTADAKDDSKRTYATEATTGVMTLHFALLGSLSGAMTRDDAEAMVNRAPEMVPDTAAAALVRFMRMPDSIYAALQTMCRTTRGMEVARKLAFREVPARDMARLFVDLPVWRFLCRGGFGESASAEDEELVWQTADKGCELFAQEKLTAVHASQTFLTWKGSTGMLGWAGVAPTLDKDFRGPIAYTLAHRYLNLSRPQEAADFLRTAIADSAPGSTLRRLAERKLATIEIPPPTRPATPPASGPTRRLGE